MMGQVGAPCPRCQHPMEPATVKTAIWRGDSLFLVEDIPAQVCGICRDQFYDETTTERLRRLTEENFASVAPLREMRVPVYSLGGQAVPPPVSLIDDDEVYADY